MDDYKQSGRPPRRTGADPQLPSYMKSNMGASRSNTGSGYVPASRSGGGTRANNGGARSSGAPRTSNPPRSGQGGSARSGGNGAARGNGGNGVRSNGTAKRKRKPTRAQRLLRVSLAVLAVLGVGVGSLLFLSGKIGGDREVSTAALQNKTYLDGITIEGLDVAGKTIEQARGALQPVITEKLAGVNITLAEDSGSWAFTSGDMDLASNLEDVLLEAMRYGREGSLSERSEQKDALELAGKDFTVSFTPDRDALIQKLDEIAIELNRPAIEPHMSATLGEDHVPVFSLQPAENGRALNTAGTADAIIELVRDGFYTSEIPVVYDVVPATGDDAYLLENTHFRAKYTTTYSNSSTAPIPNRVFNIQKAADIINGCVLQPGESWSFNDYVGLRTIEGGWKEANGISGGKEYTLQAGGGICQVSTTLYNALLCGDIQIDYRQKHSIPSDYVGYGLDCTVDSGGIDMNFTNDTSAPLYIFAYTEKNPERSRRKDITILLYGEPLPNGVTYKTRSEILEQTPREDTVYVDDISIPYGYMLTRVVPHDRIVAEAYQDKYVDGELVESKLLNKDTYRGNPAEVHVGTGDPLTTPVPEGAVPATVQPQGAVPDAYKIAAQAAAAGASSDAAGDDEGDEGEEEFDIPEVEG